MFRDWARTVEILNVLEGGAFIKEELDYSFKWCGLFKLEKGTFWKEHGDKCWQVLLLRKWLIDKFRKKPKCKSLGHEFITPKLPRSIACFTHCIQFYFENTFQRWLQFSMKRNGKWLFVKNGSIDNIVKIFRMEIF